MTMRKAEQLRNRFLQVLREPPEILYAIVHHWTLIAICAVVGLIALLWKPLGEPDIFEARAKLYVDPDPERLLVEAGPGGGGRRESSWMSRTLNAQKTTLLSEGVLKALVDGDPSLKKELAEGRDESSGGKRSGLGRVIQRINTAFESYVTDFLETDLPVAGLSSDEERTRRAIVRFRRRARITPDPRSMTLHLALLGYSRDDLPEVLDRWIDIYRRKILDLYKGKDVGIQLELSQKWSRTVERLEAKIRQYRADHPEANDVELRLVQDEITEKQLARREVADQIQRLKHGAIWVPPAVGDEDPMITSIRTKIRDLEIQIIMEEGAGASSQSTKIQELRSQVTALQRELSEKLLGRGPAEAPVGPVTQEQLANEFQAIDRTLREELFPREAQIREALDGLSALEKEKGAAELVRDQYERELAEGQDRQRYTETAWVSTIEDPWAEPRPINRDYVKHAGVGLLGGLALGIALALLAEILTGRIRFRNDIRSDLGVPVVAVVPKR